MMMRRIISIVKLGFGLDFNGSLEVRLVYVIMR